MDITIAFLEEKLHSTDGQVMEQAVEKRKKDELAILSSTSRIQKAKQAVQLEQDNKPVDLSKLRKLSTRFDFFIYSLKTFIKFRTHFRIPIDSAINVLMIYH